MNRKKISVAQPVLDGNEAQYVMNCLQENWISSRGKYIEQFEKLLAEFLGVEDVVVTNNGTTSLHLALVALGIGEGDEVIMPTLSYIATANAVRYCNATPVFVDSEAEYFSMDASKIEEAITSRTKAIMTVPLYGHPVDIKEIQRIADEYNLLLIEDSAEALGACVEHKKVGSFGNCSSFSFFGNKLITTGEGGAVATNDVMLAKRMRFLRGQAVDPNRNYWHPEIGYNYRMTNLAAAIGVGQMERIEVHLQRRRVIAKWYDEFLSPYQDLVKLPTEATWATHSYWMYTVVQKSQGTGVRDNIIKSLQDNGIETRPVFYPIHTMPAYRDQASEFAVAEYCSSNGLNLPTHGALTKEDVAYVSENLIAILKKQACLKSSAFQAA